MRNSDGEVKGPPPESDYADSGSDVGSNDGEPLDIRPDSPGWEDVEDDTESVNIQCLLCATTFTSAEAMLVHCTKSHDFDLLSVQRQHGTLALTSKLCLLVHFAPGKVANMSRIGLLWSHQAGELYSI